MGCTTSRDAVAAARPRAPCLPDVPRRRANTARLCRERAALAHAVADRRSALAAAHAAYFRSLVAVGGALRCFAEAALAPSAPAFALSPSPVAAAWATATAPSSIFSPLTHSHSNENIEAPRPSAKCGGGENASSSTAKLRYMRSSSTVPAVVYENPYAQPQSAEGEGSYGYVYVNDEVLARKRPAPTPSPPAISPWDFFDPFVQCDGFVEDYRSRRSLLESSPDSAELRKMEGIPELEEQTADADASSKPPSTSRAAGDQNAKANRDPSGGTLQRTGSEPAPGDANGEVGKRPASSKHSVPNDGSSKKGVKKNSMNLKGSVPAPVANGEKEKSVSNKDAVPSNGRSRSKQEGKKKKTSPASSKSTVNGGGINGTCSSSRQKKKKAPVIEEEEPTRSTTPKEGDDHDSHGEPATSSPLSPLNLQTRSVMAMMDEVYWLFNEAANRGVAVSRVLGTGKAVTRRTKLRVLKCISCKVSTSSCFPKPHGKKSRASRSKRSTAAASLGAGRTNDVHKLSSTLEKLWVWEKKLYREMKCKDKLRKQYRKMCRRLKSLDKGGAESSLINSTQMSVSLLRSKISVSISTANVLSLMIKKTRDEELYPQLADLIQRFRALWKAVLESHEKQLSAIQQGAEIHRIKAVTLGQSSVAAMATDDLQRELKNWRRCFDKWIGSQKSFVEALNRWLKKWLPAEEVQVEEDTPPAFVISKEWLQATEKIAMAEVLRAMDHFSKLVRELKKSQEDEQRQKRKADRASRDYHTKREDLKAALGLITGPDVAAVMENTYYRHDDRVMDLAKARRRRDDERARYDETLQHAHTAASATLPFGLVPTLKQIISFFQGMFREFSCITL